MVTHADGIRPFPLKNVIIDDHFWNRYIKLVREKVIPYQWEALNDKIPDAARSHCIKNFEIAAHRREGEYYGMVFQDSDLYKWLESVAYSLETQPDAALEKLADDVISLIGEAQQQDGYVNTYYTVKEPLKRWTNLREGHELYCAGHMIEAAVAYYYATGKRELLDISMRFADCIYREFGSGEGQHRGYPGHQEIELALVKLFEATGEGRYLDLAAYFIRVRGASPNYFSAECAQPGYDTIFPEFGQFFLFDRDWSYSQSHIPPVEQRQAVGHAVRAVYMYSAMADLAALRGDKDLLEACDALYEDIVNRQMYVTGAIGAAAEGERFTGAYNLPNDLVYGETCASVGLMMFCRRMNSVHADARYADTMERALYNTVLDGISLTGTEFFYVNPLEVEPLNIAKSPYYKHVKPVRQKWFDCSCCPTNIARTVMGLGAYIYGVSPDSLYINLYCSSSADDGVKKIAVKTDYPYGNEAVVTAGGGRYKLFLRSPENAPVLSVEVNGQKRPFSTQKGYIALEENWNGDEIRLLFDMSPKRVYSNLKSQRNTGKSAVMRGPLVYCMEQADNGQLLGSFLLPGDTEFNEYPAPIEFPSGTIALEAAAYRYASDQGGLYSEKPPVLEKATAKFIPYFLWANRGENEMRVYIQTEPPLPERAGK